MQRLLIIAAAGLLVCTSPAAAQVTNFSQDIARSIDDGLAWLDGQGAFRRNSACGDAAGLCALALLEKRRSADQNALSQGYANASPDDQQRIEDIMAYIIGRSNEAFYAYVDGANLMALTVYLRTGGPDQNGARNAINRIFDRMAQNQNGAGYWCYRNGGCNDSSTTQLVMAGIAAAKGVFDDPATGDPNRLLRLEQLASNARNAYRNNAQGGGLGGDAGHAYIPGRAVSFQQTASGLWCQIIGGAGLNDPSVQSYLKWLYYRYNYSSTALANGGWSNSYFYYLWSSAKAYTFLEDLPEDPVGGNIDVEVLGTLPPGDAPAVPSRQVHIDPNTASRVARLGGEGAGYYADPRELPRWYFDYGLQIMNLQQGNGQFSPPAGHVVWNAYSAQSYALLVLERSVGGGCIDSDDDGVCDADDLCPGIQNPDNSDADGDGIGDQCDICPDDFDPEQRDDDNDGIGDACDDIVCVEDGLPDLCDGLDNDCDGVIDEGPDGGEPVAPGDCATGLPGICGRGERQCINGEVVCIGDVVPSDDVCDGLDNDCDGTIDEMVRNACGTCDDLTDEVCDGADQDCDGVVDEGDLCTGNEVCYEGECRDPCAGNECNAAPGLYCDQENNICLPFCDGVECEDGELCNLDTGLCEDVCTGVDCPAGQRCWEGECAPDDCITTGCPDGSVCNGVECLPDPCAAADCPDGEYCRGGQCIPTCADVSCALYETCIDGACVPDDCGGVSCPDGEACVDGICQGDPCAGVECRDGQVCAGGFCVFDDCTNVECPPGQVCEMINSSPQCVFSDRPDNPIDPPMERPDMGIDPDEDMGNDEMPPPDFDGGMNPPPITPPSNPDMGPGQELPEAVGCNCDAGDDAPSPFTWLLLPLLAVVRVRRR